MNFDYLSDQENGRTMKSSIIKLPRNKKALLDPEDFAKLSHLKWHIIGTKKKLYACTSKKGKRIKMEHLIMGHTQNKKTCVDHINGNSLDNRKENLRICTISDNCSSFISSKKNRYGYRGVYKYGTRSFGWQLTHKGIFYKRAIYKTAKEAAAAYNKMAIKIRGEFARLNKIED